MRGPLEGNTPWEGSALPPDGGRMVWEERAGADRRGRRGENLSTSVGEEIRLRVEVVVKRSARTACPMGQGWGLLFHERIDFVCPASDPSHGRPRRRSWPSSQVIESSFTAAGGGGGGGAKRPNHCTSGVEDETQPPPPHTILNHPSLGLVANHPPRPHETHLPLCTFATNRGGIHIFLPGKQNNSSPAGFLRITEYQNIGRFSIPRPCFANLRPSRDIVTSQLRSDNSVSRDPLTATQITP